MYSWRFEGRTSDVRVTIRRNCLKSLNMEYTLHISGSSPVQNPLSWRISDSVQSKYVWTGLDYESSGLTQSIPYVRRSVGACKTSWANPVNLPLFFRTWKSPRICIDLTGCPIGGSGGKLPRLPPPPVATPLAIAIIVLEIMEVFRNDVRQSRKTRKFCHYLALGATILTLAKHWLK